MYDDSVIEKVFKHKAQGLNYAEISRKEGIPPSSVAYIFGHPDNRAKFQSILEEYDKTQRIIDYCTQDLDFAKKQQAEAASRPADMSQLLSDEYRVVRRKERLSNRTKNEVALLTKALNYGRTETIRPRTLVKCKDNHGIIQLGGLNLFWLKDGHNFETVHYRVMEHIRRSLEWFKGNGVEQVTIVLTGELTYSLFKKSDLGTEAAAMARAFAIKAATKTIKIAIDEVSNHFHTTVFMMSREPATYNNGMVGDNDDLTIFRKLHQVCGGYVTFKNPRPVDNSKLLLGTPHTGLVMFTLPQRKSEAGDTKLDAFANKILAGQSRTVKHLVIANYERAMISDMYSRSGQAFIIDQDGTPLRASQNAYVISRDFVDVLKNDLENVR